MRVNIGGFNLALMEIIGAGALLVALLYLALRTKSRGKQDSTPTTERATHELYKEQDRADKNADR